MAQVGAVGEAALEFVDANCPTLSVFDESSTWGPASRRLAEHSKIRCVAPHKEGQCVPEDPKVYEILAQFAAEFVGGHEPDVEEFDVGGGGDM